MHDCKDKDTRRFETVENTEGKTIHKTTAHIVVYDRPGIRMIDDALDGSKDLKRQIVAKAGFTIFVVVNSRAELFFCFRVK
jgi:hypothetical protein